MIKSLNDPYPYFRGIIAELGFEIARIEFIQPKRAKGKTSSNFYKLYDVAMLGVVSYSKVPLRLAAFIGFLLGSLSLFVAFIYFLYKLLFWSRFQLGAAPIVIGLFFFAGVQLFFIGIIGEYIGAIIHSNKSAPPGDRKRKNKLLALPIVLSKIKLSGFEFPIAFRSSRNAGFLPGKQRTQLTGRIQLDEKD